MACFTEALALMPLAVAPLPQAIALMIAAIAAVTVALVQGTQASALNTLAAACLTEAIGNATVAIGNVTEAVAALTQAKALVTQAVASVKVLSAQMDFAVFILCFMPHERAFLLPKYWLLSQMALLSAGVVFVVFANTIHGLLPALKLVQQLFYYRYKT